MRACLVLCVASALIGAVLADCTACIDGQCYHKHRLPMSEDLGWLMDIDRNRNILYTVDGVTLRQCQLDTKICNSTTDDTSSIEWLTVDQRTGNIYSRVDDDTNSYNLYKLDLVNNDTKLLFGGVWYMIFRDKLYYTPQSGKGIYTYEDGESKIIAGTEEFNALTFVVDKNEDIYFKIDLSGNYPIKKLSNGAVDRNVEWGEYYWIRADAQGNAVFIHQLSHVIYRVRDGQLAEVGIINDKIYHADFFETPVFDRDNNIIYRYNSDEYFLLQRDSDVKCTYSISQNIATIAEYSVNTQE